MIDLCYKGKLAKQCIIKILQSLPCLFECWILWHSREALAVENEQQRAVGVVAGAFADRAIGAQEWGVNDTKQQREPPVSTSREIGLRNLLGAVFVHVVAEAEIHLLVAGNLGQGFA